jgi:hypothetical protein
MFEELGHLVERAARRQRRMYVGLGILLGFCLGALLGSGARGGTWVDVAWVVGVGAGSTVFVLVTCAKAADIAALVEAVRHRPERITGLTPGLSYQGGSRVRVSLDDRNVTLAVPYEERSLVEALERRRLEGRGGWTGPRDLKIPAARVVRS